MIRQKTLNYRQPDGRGVREWTARFWKREVIFFLWEGPKLIAGVLLTFIAPGLATLIWGGVMKRMQWQTPIDGRPAFFIACAIIVPLLFWWERRTQGRYMHTAIEENKDLLGSRPSSYGEWELRRSVAGWIFYMELFLTGPRFVLSAVQRCRGWVDVSKTERSAAAWVMDALLAQDQGMPVTELRALGMPDDRLRLAVAYLRFHEWADASKDGKRIWATSAARRTVNNS